MTEYQKLFHAGAYLKRIDARPVYTRASATRVGLAYEPTSVVELNAKELRSIVAGTKQ
jgi:hypothetical protein